MKRFIAKNILYILLAIPPLAFISYKAISEPERYFGISSNSGCGDYVNAKTDYKISFLMQCGCLTPEQAISISDYYSEKKAKSCFEKYIVTQCKDGDKIGEIYRNCVAGL